MDNYRISIVLKPILGVSYQIVSASVVSGKTHITRITADWADDRSRYTGHSKYIRARRARATR